MGTGKQRPARRLLRALSDLVAGLEELSAPSMIIGGIAVIAHGVPRVTRDIDATVAIAHTSLGAIVAAMRRHRIEARIPDAIEFAAESAVLLLRHEPSGVDIDLSLAALAFEEDALRAADTIAIEGKAVRLARPEDLIVYKLAAWRPQDQHDVQRLLELHGAAMDLARVRELVGEICAALETPERVGQLEQMVRRAMPGG